jgi:glycosyltransferase involved in cell wall biosynthesis
MQRVARDPELARHLSRGGRAVYEQRASEEVLGARWRSLLEELLA